MTENKRFDIIPFDVNGNTVLIDRKCELIAVPLDFNLDILTEEEKRRLNEWLDLLNENEELKKENKGLETRNKRQYKLLTEITDLMMKRDWKSLEHIVEDWEESDRLLQVEWSNCGDV